MTACPARILAAARIAAAAPAVLAAALVNAAIIRKPPPGDETSDDSDLVAATTAAAQREGRAGTAATPHQRWTLTAHDGTRLAGHHFPAPRPARRTVILIHGHRADASLMGTFARDYRACGFKVNSVPACQVIHFSHSSLNRALPSLGSMNTRARLSWAILICASWPTASHGHTGPALAVQLISEAQLTLAPVGPVA